MLVEGASNPCSVANMELDKPVRPLVYLSAPLFSDGERAFNEMLAGQLQQWVDVYLPQRDGGLMSDMVREGVCADVAACRVFRRDMQAIRDANCVVAVLDGRTVDEGVAFELGVAVSLSKSCIGLQTDSRRHSTWGNNAMITSALEMLFHSVDGLLAWFRNEAATVSVRPGRPYGTEN